MCAAATASGTSVEPSIHPIFAAIESKDRPAIERLITEALRECTQAYTLGWDNHLNSVAPPRRHPTLSPIDLATFKDAKGRNIWSAALCAASSEEESQELCELLAPIKRYCDFDDIFMVDSDNRSLLWHSLSKAYSWVFYEHYDAFIYFFDPYDYNPLDSRGWSAYDVALISPSISTEIKRDFFSNDYRFLNELEFEGKNSLFVRRAFETGDPEIVRIALRALMKHERYAFDTPLLSKVIEKKSIFDLFFDANIAERYRKGAPAVQLLASASAGAASNPTISTHTNYQRKFNILIQIMRKFLNKMEDEYSDIHQPLPSDLNDMSRLLSQFLVRIEWDSKRVSNVFYPLLSGLACTKRKQEAEAVRLRACVTSESDERDEGESRKKRIVAVDAAAGHLSPGIAACPFLKVSGCKDILKKIFEYV